MKKPLTRTEIETYRRRLVDELAAHAGEVEAVERGALERAGGALLQDVGEPAEEAAVEGDLDVLRCEDELGYEVHEALQRIARGAFGRCEGCGGAIARERLDVVPYARTCAVCARAQTA